MAQSRYSEGVPSVEPQVGVPNRYLNVPSTPAEFGGLIGAGMERLGAGALKAGQFYGQVAADEATNQYMEESRKLLKGDPNDIQRDEQGNPILDEKGQTMPDRGFFGLEGAAAMRAQPRLEQRLADLRTRIHGSMLTGEQALRFDEDTRRMQYYQSLQIGSHAEQQAHVWAQRVEAASGTNAKQGIAEAALSGDQDALRRSENDLIGSKVQTAHRLGAQPGDDVWEAAKRQGKQESVETQILAAIGANDGAKAKALYDANQPLLAGLPHFDQLTQHVTNFADKSIGQAAGRAAFFGTGGGEGQDVGEATPNAFLASQRAGFKEELDRNPQLKKRLAAVIDIEHPEAGTAVAESLMNRMAMSGGSIESGIGGGANSFYGPVRRGEDVGRVRELEANPERMRARLQQIDQALAGSNIVRGHTDQGSLGDPNYEAGGIGVNIAGERFNDWGGHTGGVEAARQWRLQQQSQIGGGSQAPVRLAAAGEPTAAAAAPPSQGYFPTRDEVIGRIPEGLSDGAYAHAFSEASKLYNHALQATSAQRAQQKAEIRNGIPMLEDGHEFNYDPNRIRSLFPREQAEQYLDLLDDAKTIGQQKIAVRGMSFSQALDQQAANHAQLEKAPPAEYNKMKKMSDAFDKASDQHFKALFADPAGYLTTYNPQLEQLRQAAGQETPEQMQADRTQGVPTAFEKYVSALTEEETRLGVPEEYQHVLGVTGAPKMAADIMANPSQAPTKIRQMEQQYGSAWPAVWNDLVSVGKMPTGYQALGVLEEADAEQLARGLGAGKEGKAWDTLIGATIKNDISKGVRSDESVQKLLTSIRMEGATPTQIADFLGTIDTLAFSKQLEGDTAPAANAAKAFTSLYSFMPNGGARVPVKQYDAVSANARAALNDLKADNLTIPPGFSSGRPGMPTPEDYVGLIQAAPTWVNTQGDSIMLMSGTPLSRIVRDKAGQPITVKFNAAPPAPSEPIVPPLQAPPM